MTIKTKVISLILLLSITTYFYFTFLVKKSVLLSPPIFIFKEIILLFIGAFIFYEATTTIKDAKNIIKENWRNVIRMVIGALIFVIHVLKYIKGGYI